jgi:hypothetical protein
MKDWFGRPVVTVEDLEQMTPEERRADFESRIVYDLDTLPPKVRDRIVAHTREVIARRDAEQAADR